MPLDVFPKIFLFEQDRSRLRFYESYFLRVRRQSYLIPCVSVLPLAVVTGAVPGVSCLWPAFRKLQLPASSFCFVDLLCRSILSIGVVGLLYLWPGACRAHRATKNSPRCFCPCTIGIRDPRRNPPSSPAAPANFHNQRRSSRGASGTRREACS